MHDFLEIAEIDFALPGAVTGQTVHGILSGDEWGDYALLKGVGPADCSAPPYEQAISGVTGSDLSATVDCHSRCSLS